MYVVIFVSYSRFSFKFKELAYLGALEHGVYVDECQDLMEEEVYDYYGIPFTKTAPKNDSEESASDEDDEINLEGNETEDELETEPEFDESSLGFDPVEV